MAQREGYWLFPEPRRVRAAGPGSLRLEGEVEYWGAEWERAERSLGPALRGIGVGVREGGAGGKTRIVAEEVEGLGAEGYGLSVCERGVRIVYSQDAGLRWGLGTLAQLIGSCGVEVPWVEIEDEPAFAARGLMLDISRDKVPTLGSLCALVDQMERLRLNHLQLYTEHTYAYRGHEGVWRGSSPLTEGDVRALAAHCSQRGVDLAANQNCLGHMRRWLLTPGYERLAEIQGRETRWEFLTDDGRPIEKRGPFSLCPVEPGSLELVRDLLGQALAVYPSRYANIGFDEAHDVGQGRSKGVALGGGGGGGGGGGVYMEFLEMVTREVGGHGKRAMFWADMALKELRRAEGRGRAEVIAGLARLGAKKAVGLVWGYEGDAPFAEGCARLGEVGLECWVCPGTSSWLSVVGRSRVRRGNLRAAGACAGRAAGFLVTEWGDQGHRQQWPVSMMGIAMGAASAWNPQVEASSRAAGRVIFGGGAGGCEVGGRGRRGAGPARGAPRGGQGGVMGGCGSRSWARLTLTCRSGSGCGTDRRSTGSCTGRWGRRRMDRGMGRWRSGRRSGVAGSAGG